VNAESQRRLTTWLPGGTRRPEPPVTVLIVDDEWPIRVFVDRILRRAGYVTILASDGAEAIQMAANAAAIDVLVVDKMMPEMNGHEVARRLRHDFPRLKVLYFTGFTDRLFDEKGTLWEDEAFVEKPCSVKGLLEAVSLLRGQDVTSTHAEEPVSIS
jgi:two-component system cell cycle sensor histidine kinase/response regulator CckA